MGDESLRGEMMTLLLAGHETTATALSWTIHRVLTEDGVLARLRDERDAVAGGRAVAPEEVSRLEYLDATVKETLRLNPVLPDVMRILTRPMRLGGWDLPAGTGVAPFIYRTHRRPDVWPDPERFDPGRFVATRPSPYAFFPFGGGIRRCIGMAFALYEMKVVLATVFARAELALAPGYGVRVVRRNVTWVPSEGMPANRPKKIVNSSMASAGCRMASATRGSHCVAALNFPWNALIASRSCRKRCARPIKIRSFSKSIKNSQAWSLNRNYRKSWRKRSKTCRATRKP